MSIVANLRPKCRVLDPIGRLHAIDEQAAGEVTLCPVSRAH